VVVMVVVVFLGKIRKCRKRHGSLNHQFVGDYNHLARSEHCLSHLSTPTLYDHFVFAGASDNNLANVFQVADNRDDLLLGLLDIL